MRIGMSKALETFPALSMKIGRIEDESQGRRLRVQLPWMERKLLPGGRKE
jgi:hypothetical protein